MKWVIPVLVAIWPVSGRAQDVVVIGEIHDNPAHHRFQAEMVADVAPKALVFEMITGPQARAVTDVARTDAESLQDALGWAENGWPDFAMYYPIFAAAPDARLYGALVPGLAEADMRDAALEAQFDRIQMDYNLNRPLPPEIQAAREALQAAAHCHALPETALPAMVEVQRLRDAVLADAAHRALDETGGPVVVITGNGHARSDWGMPALLRKRAAGIDILSIGQSEAGAPLEGWFDRVVDAPAVTRPDPCGAFQ